jgi:hypothetical protein
MNILRVRNTVVLSLLALAPILNIGEIFSLMRGDKNAAFWFTTPLYIKLIKDAGFLLIILLSIPLLFKIDKKKRNIIILFLTALSVFTALLFFISYKNNPVQALTGLRWIMPIFLAVLLIGTIDDKFMTQIARIVAILFLISVAFQLYEIFALQPSSGFCINAQTHKFFKSKPWPGLFIDLQELLRYIVSRQWVGGIFILYNTAGFFACVTMFLAYFYIKKSALRLATLILIPVSLVLARSGTGMPVYVLSNFLIWIKGRLTMTTLFLLFAVSLLIIAPVSFLRGHDIVKYFNHRVCTRAEEALQETGMISHEFGKGTNAMVLYNQKFQTKAKGLVLDSTIAATIVNTGRAGLIIAVFLYAIWSIFVLLSGRLDAVIFTFIYSLFALTASVIEAFPMNLIFAVGVAYFIPIIFSQKRRVLKCRNTG